MASCYIPATPPPLLPPLPVVGLEHWALTVDTFWDAQELKSLTPILFFFLRIGKSTFSPTTKKRISKNMISEPMNFEHLIHTETEAEARKIFEELNKNPSAGKLPGKQSSGSQKACERGDKARNPAQNNGLTPVISCFQKSHSSSLILCEKRILPRLRPLQRPSREPPRSKQSWPMRGAISAMPHMQHLSLLRTKTRGRALMKLRGPQVRRWPQSNNRRPPKSFLRAIIIAS